MNPLTLPRQNTEAELRAFETVCDRMGGFNPDIATDWVDGFLAALAAGPRLPEPDAVAAADVWRHLRTHFCRPRGCRAGLAHAQAAPEGAV
jgi:hypothetical protein